MRKLVCPRLPQFQACVSPLGQLHTRPLFGGYSLAIEDTVFAMVADGELYLRACEQSVQYCVKHTPRWLTFMKKGRLVMLNYYRVDESLWQDQQQLIRLSRYSLDAALKEKKSLGRKYRLRDLPNITYHLESLLNEAGIKDVSTLRILGAKMCWLRLKQMNQHITVKILYLLEGAVQDIHEAALPVVRRQELAVWVESLTPDLALLASFD